MQHFKIFRLSFIYLYRERFTLLCDIVCRGTLSCLLNLNIHK